VAQITNFSAFYKWKIFTGEICLFIQEFLMQFYKSTAQLQDDLLFSLDV
jgi:hypothetical protein